MSNPAPTVQTPASASPSRTSNPKKAKAKKSGGKRGRPAVVLTADTWESVTAALKAKSCLATAAATASVSVPTMRKLLAAKFGDRIVFARGRKGGITLTA